jgi:hypothetical protein
LGYCDERGKNRWIRRLAVVKALKLQDGDWEWEKAREEYPWWISADSWVF